jgi:hypothetical protein
MLKKTRTFARTLDAVPRRQWRARAGVLRSVVCCGTDPGPRLTNGCVREKRRAGKL